MRQPQDHKGKVPSVAQRAADLDRRRQAQIQRQIEIIDRLLTGDGYDEVLRSQTEEIAKLRTQRENVLGVIRELQAEDRTRADQQMRPVYLFIIKDLAEAIGHDL